MNQQKQISMNGVALIQGLLSLSIQTPSSVADIFIDYHSHTQSLDVRVYRGGWYSDCEATDRLDVYLDYEGTEERIRIFRDKLVQNLKTWADVPPEERSSLKAAKLRETAQKLLAEAESLTAPSPSA